MTYGSVTATPLGGRKENYFFSDHRVDSLRGQLGQHGSPEGF